MKKLIAGLLIGSILTISTVAMADNIKIFVNGKETDAQPILVNDRTYVPVRAIAELIGAEVNYNGDTENVEIKTNDYATKMYDFKTLGDFAAYTELIYGDLMMLSNGMVNNDSSWKTNVDKDMKLITDYYKTLYDTYPQEDYKTVLQNYQNSLLFYQHAYSSLITFDTSNKVEDLQNFKDQLTAADSACKDGKKEADNLFIKYYSKTQK